MLFGYLQLTTAYTRKHISTKRTSEKRSGQRCLFGGPDDHC